MSQTNTLPSTMLLYVALTPQPFSTVHPNITHTHTYTIHIQTNKFSRQHFTALRLLITFYSYIFISSLPNISAA